MKSKKALNKSKALNKPKIKTKVKPKPNPKSKKKKAPIKHKPTYKTQERKYHAALIMTRVHAFFQNAEYFNQLYNVIGSNKSKAQGRIVSLRLMDYLCSTYATTHRPTIIKNGKRICIYRDYKSALQTDGKQFFDPFRRTQRLVFKHNESGRKVHTTLAQLNFFMWAITSGTLEFAYFRHKKITKDMAEQLKFRRQQQKNRAQKKCIKK